jgi:6-phosphofructokinase 1
LGQLEQRGIDGLVVIGGNGSQAGAHALSQLGFPVVGIASTIDNDLSGSDVTIGVTSAIDVALEAIDRLKVTGSSHQRAFLVEVMGRKCGYLALMAGLAGGADAIVIPEQEVDPESVAENLRAAYANGKAHAIVVVAEGSRNNAEGMANYFQVHHERLGFELRVTKLGHTQRGVAPGAYDRMLGTLLGAAATEQLANGSQGVLVGMINGCTATSQLGEVVNQKKPLDLRLLDLAYVLAK